MFATLFALVMNFFSKSSQGLKAFSFGLLAFALSNAPVYADPIGAPDMTDATGSVTAVFGAVLGVAVLIFGFKKVKSLL
ncbi:hypothetical protein [Halarcobacter mediterraneus]|uniref:hypothetical protein n=1 Tax=Halarcobacter mediterraneus TaxID=2023153 RepID=UPI00100AEB73|nr:hypothetical protein [Halarcobacter mediterraneus]